MNEEEEPKKPHPDTLHKPVLGSPLTTELKSILNSLEGLLKTCSISRARPNACEAVIVADAVEFDRWSKKE